MQDFDGLIGRFSGSEVPSTLSTDTGLLRVNFTADGSLQDEGFVAAYLASSTPQVYIPTCTDGAKLVQVSRAGSVGVAQIGAHMHMHALCSHGGVPASSQSV